jgi:homoserine O-succinyltransferase
MSAPEAVRRPRPANQPRGGLAPLVDARPLRIGVIGLGHETELRLIEPLSRAALPVHPLRIRLGTAIDTAAEVAFLRGAAVSFTRAILDEPLDGLVLTGNDPGTTVERHPHYRELTEILDYARAFVPSTLGLGAGGLLLARALGLELEPLVAPVDGVVPQRLAKRDHALLSGGSEVFFAPERRAFRVTARSLEGAAAAGLVTPIAHSRDAGVSIFESADRRFVAHLGQPDRDPPNGGISGPSSAFLDAARASARAHSDGFFAAWIGRLQQVARAREGG